MNVSFDHSKTSRKILMIGHNYVVDEAQLSTRYLTFKKKKRVESHRNNPLLVL